jgi:hypothetical protein
MLHLCGANVNTSLVEALRPHCVNWSIHDAGNPTLVEMRDRHHVAVAGSAAPRPPDPDGFRRGGPSRGG